MRLILANAQGFALSLLAGLVTAAAMLAAVYLT